ncbi:MAG: hemerythrin family protein [Hyphomicrobiales bacterium]|nr:hemerythrin family protein [Hyphomicrobiales bacterium]
MTKIVWSEAMSVGVPPLDSDHRIIIDLIGRLDDHGADLSEAINTLIAYTEYHFFREERVMAECGYPELEAHRQEHGTLADDVMALQRRYADGDDSVTAYALQQFLTEWLYHHILLEDMAYKPYAEHCARAHDAAKAFGKFRLEDLHPELVRDAETECA